MTAYRDVVLADNPVSFWECSDSALTSLADAEGANTGGGWNSGGVTLGQAGIVGATGKTAALLDGSTGYGSVPNSSSLQITGNISIECWFNPANANNNVYSRVAVKPSGPSPALPYNDYALVTNGNGPNFTGFELTLAGTNQICYTSTVPTAGVWHHLVGTYDGSTMRLYLDGVQAATASHSGAVTANSLAFQIGRLPGGSYFNGTVQNVAVYSSALSAARVSAHYVAGMYGIGTGGRLSSDGNLATLDFGTTDPLASASSAFWSLWLHVVQWDGAGEQVFHRYDGVGGWAIGGPWSVAADSTQFYMSGPQYYNLASPVYNQGWVHLGVYFGSGGSVLRTYRNGSLAASYTTDPHTPFTPPQAGTTLQVLLGDPQSAVAEPALFVNPTQAQADTLAANLAAGRSPMAQAITPAFYVRFGSGSTETSLVGSYSATVPSNAAVVPGPAVDAPSLLASGSVAFSGAASASLVHSRSASGSVAFSGVASESRVHPDAAHGTLSLSGAASALDAHVYHVWATGTVSFSATTIVRSPRYLSASGSVAFAGLAADAQLHAWTLPARGHVAFSGRADDVRVGLASATGRLSLAGTAFVHSPRYLTASGSVAFVGAGAGGDTHTLSASAAGGSAAFVARADAILLHPGQTWPPVWGPPVVTGPPSGGPTLPAGAFYMSFGYYIATVQPGSVGLPYVPLAGDSYNDGSPVVSVVTTGGRVALTVAAGSPAQVLKANAGRLVRVFVTVAGSGVVFYDNATAGATTGNVVGIIPGSATVGQSFDFSCPFGVGLSATGGAGTAGYTAIYN